MQIHGDFFYANTKYIKHYDIDLSYKKNLNFNNIKACSFTFEYLKSKLLDKNSFSIQKQKGKIWLESTFFYTAANHIIHTFRDITSVKEKEIELDIALAFFNNINEGILITDEDGLIQSVNRAFSNITGYTKDEAIGKKPNILKSGRHDLTFYENMWKKIEGNGHWKDEIWDKRKNGDIYPQILSISKVLSKKHQDKHYYISIFSDITNIKKEDKKNYYHANYDSLTKLLNRSSFNRKFEAMLSQAQKNDSKIALFFIDVDRFKEINDRYGHDVGDKILVALARRLLNSVKKDDVMGRIGGDEFVLIAKNIKNIKDVDSLALKLQNKIREPINIDGEIFNITLSIGISIYPQHGTSRHDLLKNADIAMYEVKRSTRDNFKAYDQFMSNNIYTKLFMQNSVRKALKKDEFVMYYQPVINLHTNSIVGAEALVRWSKSKNNVLEPAHFLKFVLSGDMSKEFGDMVVSKVLQDLTLLNEVFLNKKLILSINISKDQLLNSNFSSEFISLFKNYNITPSQIELEIFEVEIIQNSDIVKKNIENLSSIGFSIVFDNFGIGNSSLSFLRDIKVDKLKIDRSFIKNMIENKKDLKITKSIVDMAKLFDLKVQAEGVETKEQYMKLKNMGCDYSQGFYYSSAAPMHDFINFCNKI